MITEAIICDESGEPFTPERFMIEPDAAQKFLELIETNSMGLLPAWRELPNDDLLALASQRLHAAQQDLITAEFLKGRDLIQ